MDYPRRKVRVTLRPESPVLRMGVEPPSLALLLLFQDPAAQLDR